MKLPLSSPKANVVVAVARFALLLLTAVALIAPCAAAEDSGDGWSAFADKVGSTTPFPLGTQEARAEGFWHGLWDGTKRIWNEGSQDLYLSGYYYHAPYHYSSEKRDAFNDTAWGLGFGHTLTEDNDNQRMLLGIVARDSYRKPLYVAGYVWLARWDMGHDVRVGAGYAALVVAHSTATNYWPAPLLAPVASIGTNNAAIYGTYVRGVAWFVVKLSFDR
jgi:palmitoyl transferase